MTERLTTRDSRSSNETELGVSTQEKEILARVSAGQTEAFAEIVRLYQDRIFNTCWRISGNLEDARDLTQEAFLKAFERLATFKAESAFYTWMFRIAVNLSISHKRSGARRPTVSLDGLTEGTQADTLAQRAGASEPDASGPASTVETQRLVVAALQALDDDYRAVVVLRDMEGLGYHEIGEILEIPYGTVKSRLHRARQAIREAIAPARRRGDLG